MIWFECTKMWKTNVNQTDYVMTHKDMEENCTNCGKKLIRRSMMDDITDRVKDAKTNGNQTDR